MKHLLLGLFLIPTLSFGQIQLPKDDNGVVTYSTIIQNDSLDQKAWYNKVKDLGVTLYQDPRALQSDNPFDYVAYKGFSKELYADFLIKFFIKPGKVKVVLTGITLGTGGASIERVMEKDYEKYKERAARGKKYDLSFYENTDIYMKAMLSFIEKNLKKQADF